MVAPLANQVGPLYGPAKQATVALRGCSSLKPPSSQRLTRVLPFISGPSFLDFNRVPGYPAGGRWLPTRPLRQYHPELLAPATIHIIIGMAAPVSTGISSGSNMVDRGTACESVDISQSGRRLNDHSPPPSPSHSTACVSVAFQPGQAHPATMTARAPLLMSSPALLATLPRHFASDPLQSLLFVGACLASLSRKKSPPLSSQNMVADKGPRLTKSKAADPWPWPRARRAHV